MRGYGLANGQHVVGNHAQSNQQWPAFCPFIDRYADAQGSDEVRRNLAQRNALAQRLEYQRYLAILKVAKTAMDQPARRRGRAAAQVVLIENNDSQPP